MVPKCRSGESVRGELDGDEMGESDTEDEVEVTEGGGEGEVLA